jgi:uncharacterized protein
VNGAATMSTDLRPWYREPWPWFLLGVPVATIVAGVITMVIAARGADGVVAEDYYKRGLEIGVEARRQQQARALNLRAEVEWDGLASGDAIRMTLQGQDAGPAATVRLRLVHPAHGDGDRMALLSRAPRADGSVAYVGAWSPSGSKVVPRVAQVVLETETWRLDGSWNGAGAVALSGTR